MKPAAAMKSKTEDKGTKENVVPVLFCARFVHDTAAGESANSVALGV